MAFNQNSYEQLERIYIRSEYCEPSHLQYPVYFIPKDTLKGFKAN
jgi:hypothetical protein